MTIRELAEAAGRAVGREPVFEEGGGRRRRRRRRHRALPRVARRPRRSCRSTTASRARPRSGRASRCAGSPPSSTSRGAGSSSRSCCAMTDAMRAPRAGRRGLVRRARLGLGNRRLAIIDLSAGGPPADVERGRLGRDRLQRRALQLPRAAPRAARRAGTASARATDTEVVAARLRGVGAGLRSTASTACSRFAIWDARRRSCSLARDRFGVKPLYYAEHGERLLFGSEIKACSPPGCRAQRRSPRRCVEYFTFQNIFSDRTLFEGVRMLPPGTR